MQLSDIRNVRRAVIDAEEAFRVAQRNLAKARKALQYADPDMTIPSMQSDLATWFGSGSECFVTASDLSEAGRIREWTSGFFEMGETMRSMGFRQLMPYIKGHKTRIWARSRVGSSRYVVTLPRYAFDLDNGLKLLPIAVPVVLSGSVNVVDEALQDGTDMLSTLDKWFCRRGDVRQVFVTVDDVEALYRLQNWRNVRAYLSKIRDLGFSVRKLILNGEPVRCWVRDRKLSDVEAQTPMSRYVIDLQVAGRIRITIVHPGKLAEIPPCPVPLR